MSNSYQNEEVTSVSSWKIVTGMIPAVLKLNLVVLKHPASAAKMMLDARRAEKRLKKKYRTVKRIYEIPLYDQNMKNCISKDPYLSPARYIEADAPEIIALANQLGAYRLSNREYAEAVFNFIKMKIWFTFATQLQGALGTLKSGEAMCLDKTHLFIALCRVAGIPTRFRIAQEAFSENIYKNLTETDPIMKDWYNSTGYFIFHAMAEAYIDGEWIPADFSMDYRYEAALGLPLSRLGDEPEGTWNWSLPGSVRRFAALPSSFAFMIRVIFKMGTGMMLTLQERMETEGIDLGMKALAEAGGEEAYDRKVRETYKAKLPEVSKKLFKAFKESEASTGQTGYTLYR